MALFKYKGRNRGGGLTHGRREADSMDSLARQLSQAGVIPIDISEVTQTASTREQLALALGVGKPGLVDLIFFTRQMHALTKAGIPMIQGLNLVAESTRNDQLAQTLYNVFEDLEAGRELSSGLARHPSVFNNLYVNIIRVGEKAGKLEEAFFMLYQYLDSDRIALQKIKSALFYPITVIVAIICAVTFLMVKVIPIFAEVFKNFKLDLPLQTKIIIYCSNFFADYWMIIFGIIILVSWRIRKYIKTSDGKITWHQYKLKIPRIGDIILRATLARFSRAFFMSNAAGIPILQGLTLTGKAIDNAYIESKINEMRLDVEKGESITRAAMATKLFTPLVVQMLAVGEETGKIDEMMKEVAEFYESEVAYDVDNITKIIEPILTLALGLMVLILAMGIFLPMWDLVQIAQK
ncbi:MAG TPA: type II secretion system F family protein [Pseudomonadales bacterium]